MCMLSELIPWRNWVLRSRTQGQALFPSPTSSFFFFLFLASCPFSLKQNFTGFAWCALSPSLSLSLSLSSQPPDPTEEGQPVSKRLNHNKTACSFLFLFLSSSAPWKFSWPRWTTKIGSKRERKKERERERRSTKSKAPRHKGGRRHPQSSRKMVCGFCDHYHHHQSWIRRRRRKQKQNQKTKGRLTFFSITHTPTTSLRIACFFSTFCTPPSPSPSPSKEQPISSLFLSSLYAPSPSFLPPLLLFAAARLFLASVQSRGEREEGHDGTARAVHCKGVRGCHSSPARLPQQGSVRLSRDSPRLGCSSANVLTSHPFEPFWTLLTWSIWYIITLVSTK